MPYVIPEEWKDEYNVLRKANWKKLQIGSLVLGVIMFVLATGVEDWGFGMLIGISTLLAALWLSFYLAGIQAAETLRKRLNR